MLQGWKWNIPKKFSGVIDNIAHLLLGVFIMLYSLSTPLSFKIYFSKATNVIRAVRWVSEGILIILITQHEFFPSLSVKHMVSEITEEHVQYSVIPAHKKYSNHVGDLKLFWTCFTVVLFWHCPANNNFKGRVW